MFIVIIIIYFFFSIKIYIYIFLFILLFYPHFNSVVSYQDDILLPPDVRKSNTQECYKNNIVLKVYISRKSVNEDRRRFFRRKELLYYIWNTSAHLDKKKNVEVAIGIGNDREQGGAEENESGH